MQQKNIDDGYIKFRCEHTCADWGSKELPLCPELKQCILDLDKFRTLVYEQGFIGMYENGIGYGNLSHRFRDKFVITASATGSAKELGIDGYTLVTGIDLDQNTVRSTGPLPASSETMTHAAIYEASPKVRCVLHIHSRILFDALKESNALHTDENIVYGTPEMAKAIKAIAAKHPSEGIAVMLGHDEGVIIYGLTAEHVQSQLAFLCREAKKSQCGTCGKNCGS